MPSKALFAALVGVTQTLFQTQYAVADDRETEVSRLDGAGVDRADRNLVHAIAFNLDERIGVELAHRRADEILAQRIGVGRPGAMAQPLAVIHCTLGLDAEQVEGGTLHAVGLREDVRQIGIGRRFSRQRHADPDQSGGSVEGDVDGIAITEVSVVCAPQRLQLPTFILHRVRQRQQLADFHLAAPDMRRDQVQIPFLCIDLHLSLPAKPQPGDTTWPDKAG
jgi:hypothetical protein